MKPLGALSLFSQLLIQGFSCHDTEVSRHWKVIVHVSVVVGTLCLYITALFSTLLLSTDYRDLLMEHHPHIDQLLDLPSLIPHLNAHYLLTPGQAEHLGNEHFSHSQRVGKLLEYIQRKGLEGYRLFLQAIEEERTHIGHKELYTVLSKSKPSKCFSHKLRVGKAWHKIFCVTIFWSGFYC